jgi:hypothetical protein
VAREHGGNSNQVSQWRYEYRKGILGGRSMPATKLLPVVGAVAVVPVVTLKNSEVHEDYPLPAGFGHIWSPFSGFRTIAGTVWRKSRENAVFMQEKIGSSGKSQTAYSSGCSDCIGYIDF